MALPVIFWSLGTKDTSSVWVVFLQCVFFDAYPSLLLIENFLPQSGQTNGFSPVWILRCLFKSPIRLKRSCLQSRHTNGFSPVWNSKMYIYFKLRDLVKLLVTIQYRRTAFHKCEFYDASFKWLLCLNFLSQSGQGNDFSPVWILRCTFKFLYYDVKLLLAINTSERLFTSVNSEMHVQVTPLFIELLVTVRTGEPLFTSVNSTMIIQMTSSFELLITIKTGERIFTSVNSTMRIHFAT